MHAARPPLLGAQHGRGEQRAERNEQLRVQGAFFAFFARCGRFLP
jgi:hypothetical protein